LDLNTAVFYLWHNSQSPGRTGGILSTQPFVRDSGYARKFIASCEKGRLQGIRSTRKDAVYFKTQTQ